MDFSILNNICSNLHGKNHDLVTKYIVLYEDKKHGKGSAQLC